ncbi:hypothetical protein K0M31_004060 [Melipona bicolor]|uniref:Uncharacterized protein n=1 Tax=Melipona bicolor TaxID=60889 RepID=A0AA40KP31_9HYME|nr:hypothetical protein K0M31_004060 [Melipona bicolor]
MEGSLSTFGGPSWGADSTSPQPPETARTRVPVQTPSPENNVFDDRRLHVNSIREAICKIRWERVRWDKQLQFAETLLSSFGFLTENADRVYRSRYRGTLNSDRNNPVQGVRRQEQRRSLWRDHLRGLQRLLQAVAVVGRQLSMPAEQELRGRPCKQKPVPVLSVAKVPTPRHV